MREQFKDVTVPRFLGMVEDLSNNVIEEELIKAYLEKKIGNYAVADAIKSLDMSIDVETLTYLFEALLDKSAVNENGIVFTPEYIASFICEGVFADLKTWDDNIKIIDPGCGCGIFLVAAVLYIHNTYNIPVKKIIKDNIFGIDIIPENVSRCKKILLAIAEKNGETLLEKDINIVSADSLKLDWNDAFHVDGFTYVIGNPPYVNTHDMSKETAAFLKKNFETTKSGVYNIFYAFVERAMTYLCDDGKLGYIVPNNFLTIKAATELRAFIQKNKYLVSILDFADNMVFKPVRTYNCIIMLDKKDNEKFKYCVLEKTDDIKTRLNSVVYDEMPVKNIDKAGWKLVDHKTYLNLSKIENQFISIKDYVRTGIATLRDEVFMVNYDDGEYWKIIGDTKYIIEPEIVKTLYKVPELKNCENLSDVKRHIIFPYFKGKSGYEIIKEDDFKDRYPMAFSYLLAMKSELDKRDKGKPNPVAWYAYGRTQGLNKYGRKLLFPTFADTPKFLLVEDDTALFCNGYGIFENDYLDLEELIAVLNSKVMDYYVSNTSYSIEGGYYCYQKKYIERFSLPWFSAEERTILRNGNREQVNEMLIEKYGIAI